MFKIGLKLWSTNKQYIPDAVKFFAEGIYDYIELFAVPGSYDEHIHLWKALDIPYVIHAPHFYQGMCLSRPEAFTQNMKMAAEALNFADKLKAPWVIFHSGVGGEITETARQLKVIEDARVLIENKPRIGVNGEMCNGYSPEEILFLQQEAGVGFCLDVGHAICAANALKIDKTNYLRDMLTLNPKLFHMTDGDEVGIIDQHHHFGEGSYDFNAIFDLLPSSMRVTIECAHSYQNSLQDFIVDALFIKKYAASKIRQTLEFKRASWKDVGVLFDLANDPVVRQNARSSHPITLTEHLSWFAEKVTDSSVLLLLVYTENIPICVLRFEQCREAQETITEVSIWIHKQFRGIGLGKNILEKGIKLAQEWGAKKIQATILSTNTTSRKLFLATDFEEYHKQEEFCGRIFKIYKKNSASQKRIDK